eukprot:2800617-Prymnesium_polylepis.2
MDAMSLFHDVGMGASTAPPGSPTRRRCTRFPLPDGLGRAEATSDERCSRRSLSQSPTGTSICSCIPAGAASLGRPRWTEMRPFGAPGRCLLIAIPAARRIDL